MYLRSSICSCRFCVQAYTLLPESYREEEWHAIEKEKVWKNSWVCVGTVDQVAKHGDTITAKIADTPIFITRNKKGELNGFHNVWYSDTVLFITTQYSQIANSSLTPTAN